jgi:hypothetical protein
MEGQVVGVCPVCGGDHDVAGACAGRAVSYGEWEPAAEVPSLVEAKLIALYLEESGFEARVLDQTFHQEPLPSVRAFSVVRVLVERDRAEEARTLLRQPREALDFSDEIGDGTEPEG